MQPKQIEFCGTVKHETQKAFLVSDGINDVWLAKSQILNFKKVGNGSSADFVFDVPEWLAIEKGIV